jgi:alcohol dehydrogenase class IV
MVLNFESLFSSRSLGRFFASSKFLWGDRCSFEVLERLSQTSTSEIFVDALFANSDWYAKLLKSSTVDTKIKLLSGPPIYEEIVRFCEENPDLPELIVTVGGGSVSDFAKGTLAIRHLGHLDGLGIGDLSGKQHSLGYKPYVIAIPTTSGSGAESSRYVVTYRDISGEKIHGKSWQLVADEVYLDPTHLERAPASLIVTTAFDAFVHFFESYFCRSESTVISRLVSICGLNLILENIYPIMSRDLTNDELSNLMLAGSIGGVAISNTRTGHVHEAAGALLEDVNLTHAQTLWVFFPEFCNQLLATNHQALSTLLSKVNGLSSVNFPTMDSLLDWWRKCFVQFGIIEELSSRLIISEQLGQIRQEKIVHRVATDKVWVDKECPVFLDTSEIERFVSASLDTYKAPESDI